MTRSNAETLSLALLERVNGRVFTAAQKTNAQSVIDALTIYGERFGVLQPHRLVQFLAQLMHESAAFAYDREIWGPTPDQKRYEGRKDLGNVQKGDGSRYRGRGPIQVTGRANYRAFSKWAKSIDSAAPNFETSPDKITTDPWEGLSPLWYWQEGNPDGKSLNRLADTGDIENITRKINGGLNGYADRLRYYDRLALAFLGYGVNEMPRFQKEAGLKDTSGTSGPLTRAALHKALLKLTRPHDLSAGVSTAPVVEEVPIEVKVPVPVDKPVVPAQVEKEVRQKTNWFTSIFSGTGFLGALGAWAAGVDPVKLLIIVGVVLAAGLGFLLLGEWIVRRVKSIRQAIAT